jgi:hypothetical protein
VLLICVPIQIIVAALYPATNGRIQISSGIVYKVCNIRVPLASLPTELNPPPPAGATYAVICHSSFFAWETARWLTVGRETTEGIVTKTFTIDYPLDRDNNLTPVHSVDWVALLVIFLYLVTFEYRFGSTFGKNLLGLRVIDTREGERRGIPLGAAIVRNLLLWIGAYPMVIVFLGAAALGALNAESFFSGGLFTWFMTAGFLGLALYAWILITIARKCDPIYDAMASTAVVLRDPTISPAAAGP